MVQVYRMGAKGAKGARVFAIPPLPDDRLEVLLLYIVTQHCSGHLLVPDSLLPLPQPYPP